MTSNAAERACSLLAEIKSKSWKASLPFSGYRCLQSEPVLCCGHPSYKAACDLFDELPAPDMIDRFDPGEYPLPGESMDGYCKGSSGWRLITDLQNASADLGGCELVSNGKGGRQVKRQYLTCKHKHTARNKGKHLLDKTNFRGTQLHCNRHLNRHGGQSMMKMTNTELPTCIQKACKVYLAVEFDDYSYLIRGKHMKREHTGHLRKTKEEIKVSSRRLTDDARASIRVNAVCKNKLVLPFYLLKSSMAYVCPDVKCTNVNI